MSVSTRALRHVDPFVAAQRELDVLFGRLVGNGQAAAPFPVDVRESGDNLIFEAELPGFSKEQVDITLENSVLTLSAERTVNQNNASEAPVANDATVNATPGNGTPASGVPAPTGGYLLRERRYTRFERSFTLPSTIDGSSVAAKLENGILTVTLSKRQEAKPRKITVN